MRPLKSRRLCLTVSVVASFSTLCLLASQSPLSGPSRIPTHAGDQGDNVFFGFLGNFKFSEVRPTEEVIERHSDSNVPKVVILWSTWRSGSTFFGELLSKALPNTFYSIEPLHYWGTKIYKESNETFMLRTYLHDLLHCQVNSTFKKQVLYMSKTLFSRQWNPYFFDSCEPKRVCGNSSFLNQKCKEAELHVAKILRLPLKWAWPLLQDEELDLKIIYLARDPRAVMLSRSKLEWCRHESCIDQKIVCESLDQDLMEAEKLQKNFPQKFKFIHYERMANDIYSSTKNLMMFTGLPLSKKQMHLLHPKSAQADDQYSTKKNYRQQVDRWRLNSDYRFVSDVQKVCLNSLRMLGLRILGSEQEFRNVSLPMVVSDLGFLT